MNQPIVLAENLIKNYGDFQAVKDVSFTIYPGQCYGILGPNGAGKTTTVAMIYCFLPVTAGRLEVLGLDATVHRRQIKAQLGVVPQEDNLDLELTVIENLVIYASYFGIPKQVATDRAEQLLDFFKLTEKRNVSVEQLSGGMKRRLTLARGLINNPKLLILDEPTTGLDPDARHHIWHHLRQLKQQGLTIILTTHYLEEASQLCDYLLIIDEGKILEEGTPEELVKKHVGKQVLQLEPAKEVEKFLTEQLRQMDISALPKDYYRVIGNTLYLYWQEDDRQLSDSLRQLPGISYRVQRPANLEDVFLKLTGRGLSGE
jgi:lipooligosaccharide transport system ATP-binding protein